MTKKRPYVDEFLEALRTQGETESTGQFTLDVRKALEKLQEYQFTDKHHYILSLVASAVAGGATFVELDSRMGVLVLSYDGQPHELSELRNIYGTIFAQQTPETAYLRELAIGLHGAGAVRPERSLVSWDSAKGRGVQMVVRPEQLLLTPLETSPFEKGLVNRLVMRTSLPSLPELEAVTFHARHCRALVRVNGHEVNERRPDHLPLAFEGVGFQAVLHIPPERETGSAHWVVHGLSYPATEGFLLGFGHLRIHADELQKDLSQSRLVDNPAKAELALAVKRDLVRALAGLGERSGELADPWPERVRGWLLELVAEALEKGGLGLWAPLWDVPWLDCAYGGKTSLDALDKQQRQPKAPRYIPVTREAFPYDDPPFHVLLETPAIRGPLRRIFPKVIYEW